MKEVTSLNSKNKKTVSVSYKAYYAVSLLYLVLPVIIFILGFLRIYIAVPAAILLLGAYVWSVKDSNSSSSNLTNTTCRDLEIPISFFIVLIVASLILTVIFNIGEFVWGTTDHAFRRAIFRDLVNYKWPVIYDLSTQSNPIVNATLPDVKVAFSYYFSFWMVPAVIGKVLGFSIGNIALVIWSALGMALTFIGMAMVIRRCSYAIIFTYVFFSGLDILPYFYYQSHGTQEWMWLEGYTEHIVYISNVNDLLNVFNQCIPCWLIVVMLMLTLNNRSIGLVGALSFAYSPWATIGMVPLAVYFLIRKEVMTSDTKTNVKNILHPINVVSALLMLGIFAPMYMANSNATSVLGNTIGFYGSVGAFIVGYIFTFVIEILPIGVLLWKDYRKNVLFWVTIAVLMVMPFYKISGQNDFTMRGSMPEFFVLTVMLAAVISRVMLENKNDTSKTKTLPQLLKSIGAIVLLITMSFVAFQMLLIVLTSTFDGSERYNEDIYSLGDVNKEEYLWLIDEQFYVYDYEDSFFFAHMARRN